MRAPNNAINRVDSLNCSANRFGGSVDPTFVVTSPSSSVAETIPLSLLLIEDSEEDALIILHELKQGGYDIDFEQVDSSGKLEASLAARSWELILSDFAMPQFSGTVALRRFSTSPVLRTGSFETACMGLWKEAWNFFRSRTRVMRSCQRFVKFWICHEPLPFRTSIGTKQWLAFSFWSSGKPRQPKSSNHLDSALDSLQNCLLSKN
jgi:hypothetical protein